MKKKLIVIGGGIAGMQAAVQLSSLGYLVDLIEKDEELGGNVRKWKKIFPYLDESSKIIEHITENLKKTNVNIHTNSTISYVEKKFDSFLLISDKNKLYTADAIVVATGFEVFDAHKKEEYGYGIFSNVITNEDLEKLFHSNFAEWKGKMPNKIGFIHCVGSRDAKAGNIYCSKVCCVTAVKQAIEVKQHFPNTDVYCFYMDLRMYGKHFEELYKEAQERYNINFVRARLSEVNETTDQKLLIKVEDTLTSKPMKLTLDYIILMAGMVPSKGTEAIEKLLKININENKFLAVKQPILSENESNQEGVFIVGTATGPKTIIDTLNDASACALIIHEYLKRNPL